MGRHPKQTDKKQQTDTAENHTTIAACVIIISMLWQNKPREFSRPVTDH